MNAVNRAYEAYRKDPTNNEKALYDSLRAYARRLGTLLLSSLPNSRYFHACENAATNALMSLRAFDPDKAAFSTWAYQSICGDLKDWKRKFDRRAFSEQEYASLSETRRQMDHEDWLVSDMLSALDDDERKLVQLKIEDASLQEIASHLGISTATVKRRWKALAKKLRTSAGSSLQNGLLSGEETPNH